MNIVVEFDDNLFHQKHLHNQLFDYILNNLIHIQVYLFADFYIKNVFLNHILMDYIYYYNEIRLHYDNH